MKNTNVISLMYAGLIFIVFAVIMSCVRVEDSPHIADTAALASFPYDEKYATIQEAVCEKYCDRFILPEEIGNYTPDPSETDYRNYVTFHVTVPVKKGVSYAISSRKSDYALNIYVDGRLLVKTGNVSDDEKSFVPTASAYEAFFTAEGDTCDIVIWQANYNHYKHYPIWFKLGPAEKIAHLNMLTVLKSSIVTVVLLTAGLMNIGLFFCFRKKREALWFSFICLTAAISNTFPEISGFVIPNFNWYLSHKLETCSVTALLFFIILYVGEKFRPYVTRVFFILALYVTGAIFGLFAFLPSAVYSRLNEVAIAASVVTFIPMLLHLTVKLIKNHKAVSQSNRLAIYGVLAFAFLSLNEAVGYVGFFGNLDIFGLTTGVSIFVFFNSLALTIDFRTSEEMFEQSRAREQELAQTNEMLTRLGRIRENFFADISHELKTPLTVIATNAALSSRIVTMGKADASTAERLNGIEREAVRLGAMVEKLKKTSNARQGDKAECIDMKKALSSAADFCNPLCARNENTITVECADDIIAYASANTMFHCIYNLISNATRHSREENIELICTEDSEEVVVSVRDHGEGMSEQAKEHAFERGFSNDSSTGIGLPLCRELVQSEGGRIYLSDTEGGGLTVSFTLKRGDQNGKDSVDRG